MLLGKLMPTIPVVMFVWVGLGPGEANDLFCHQLDVIKIEFLQASKSLASIRLDFPIIGWVEG